MRGLEILMGFLVCFSLYLPQLLIKKNIKIEKTNKNQKNKPWRPQLECTVSRFRKLSSLLHQMMLGYDDVATLLMNYMFHVMMFDGFLSLYVMPDAL